LENRLIRLRSSLNAKRKKLNTDKWKKRPFLKPLGKGRKITTLPLASLGEHVIILGKVDPEMDSKLASREVGVDKQCGSRRVSAAVGPIAKPGLGCTGTL